MNAVEERKKTDGPRELLMAAAKELFVQKGYQAVSTRELADRAGVNLAAIQYHFGSKAKLFVAAVHDLIGDNHCAKGAKQITIAPRSEGEAAHRLHEFVHNLMKTMICADGPRPCRLIFRELLSDTSNEPELFEAIVSSTVENFSLPLQQTLTAILTPLLPGASVSELQRTAQSIIAQCSFHVTHQPFLERMWGGSLRDEELFAQSVNHITQFSLRALGCSSDVIEQALQQGVSA